MFCCVQVCVFSINEAHWYMTVYFHSSTLRCAIHYSWDISQSIDQLKGRNHAENTFRSYVQNTDLIRLYMLRPMNCHDMRKFVTWLENYKIKTGIFTKFQSWAPKRYILNVFPYVSKCICWTSPFRKYNNQHNVSYSHRTTIHICRSQISYSVIEILIVNIIDDRSNKSKICKYL